VICFSYIVRQRSLLSVVKFSYVQNTDGKLYIFHVIINNIEFEVIIQ
jgi:hypothetical protein